MFQNLVKETCTGTGDEITLLGAEEGFLPFSLEGGEGMRVAYVILDADGEKKVSGVSADFYWPDKLFRNDTWAYDGDDVVSDPSVNITLSGGTHTIYCAESAEQLEAIMNSIAVVDSNTRKQNRNYIINGNFDVWQRGTSQTANGYASTDRWSHNHSGTGVSKTVTRQAFDLGDIGGRREARYYARTVVTGGSAAGGFCLMLQRIEGVHSLAGKQATVSFWARADATRDIAVEFIQQFGSGGSPSSTVLIAPQKVTAFSFGFQKFELTIDIPSISGKTLGTNGNDFLAINFWFSAGSDFNDRTLSIGNQSGTFEIAQVQVEEGDRATEFELLHPSEILSQCQRYFNKTYPQNLYPGNVYADPNVRGNGGFQLRANNAAALYQINEWAFPVTMRAIPSVTLYSLTGAAGVVRNISTTSNSSDFEIQSITTGGAIVSNANAVTVGNIFSYHATADAEL